MHGVVFRSETEMQITVIGDAGVFAVVGGQSKTALSGVQINAVGQLFGNEFAADRHFHQAGKVAGVVDDDLIGTSGDRQVIIDLRRKLGGGERGHGDWFGNGRIRAAMMAMTHSFFECLSVW